jgi:hypothetical protein
VRGQTVGIPADANVTLNAHYSFLLDQLLSGGKSWFVKKINYILFFMKQVFLILTLVVGALFLGGCDYKIVKTSEIKNDQSELASSTQAQIDNLKNQLDSLKQKESVDTKSLKLAQKSGVSLSSIITEWRTRTAFLVCNGIDSATGQAYSQTATAYIHRFANGNVRAITNKHAVTDSYGNLVSGCEIQIPTDPVSIFVTFKDMISHPDPTIDASEIALDNNDKYISSMTKKKVCFQQSDVKVNVGDQVVILGYPAIGSQTDITATEGIISGYNYPYYITSAKIDHGNSGGLAILVKGDCYLGIPSGAVVGSIESLGRILEASAIQSTAQKK